MYEKRQLFFFVVHTDIFYPGTTKVTTRFSNELSFKEGAVVLHDNC